MPLYMDFHKIENVTIEAVKTAHMADKAVQEKYGVKYHQFWVNEQDGTVFCLVEGPDPETCEKVHQIAHGNLACALTKVERGFYNVLMGQNHQIDQGLVREEDGSPDLGYRSILAVSIFGITKAKESKDLELLQIPENARNLVIELIKVNRGRQVSWPKDDSLIGVFNDADNALECAITIQEKFSSSKNDWPVIFKVGLNADQPVTEEGDFFNQAITMAHQLSNACTDNKILASSLFKKLGKNSKIYPSSIKYLTHKEETFIKLFIDFANQNLSKNNFGIDQLCSQLGISRPQLYRKLTSLTGRSPNNLLKDLRLEKAVKLLREKNNNISQVAMQVGYSNPSYFSKCFAEKFGFRPSEIHFVN